MVVTIEWIKHIGSANGDMLVERPSLFTGLNVGC